MLSNIQAVFFDLGDTLVHIKHNVLERICEAIGKIRGRNLSIEEYMIAFQTEWHKRQDPISEDLIKSVATDQDEIEYWTEFFAALLIELGVPALRCDVFFTMAKIYSTSYSYELFDDVIGALKILRSKGIKLGVISNAFPSAKRIMNELGLEPHLDYVLLSYDIEHIKPEPEIYHFAVDALGVDLQNSIFVDDRWKFVKAARDLGMKAYLIERFQSQSRNLKTTSLVPKISSLHELQNEIFGGPREIRRKSNDPFPMPATHPMLA